MGASQEELENELHTRFAADQAAQLHEEEELISHPKHPLSSSKTHREDLRESLLGILEEHFDTERQVEFAYLMMAKAYKLGSE